MINVGVWSLWQGLMRPVADLAIFLMSLHMNLQIFPPKRPALSRYFGHDGLYRCRRWILALWIILPNTIAALAFANPSYAYQAAGAFCILPVRPYWYRLALSWAPRYLVWIFITGVAIRIYVHAGKQFKVFGHQEDGSTSLKMPGQSSVDRARERLGVRRTSMAAAALEEVPEKVSDDNLAPEQTPPEPSKASTAAPSSLAKSAPTLITGNPSFAPYSFQHDSSATPLPSNSNNASRCGSQQITPGILAADFAPPSPQPDQRRRGSVATLNSIRSATAPSAHSIPGLTPIVEDRQFFFSTDAYDTGDGCGAAKVAQNRRRAIQRQLRLLFIYPVVYSIIWIIPFIAQCFNYNDYYAQNPIFVLSAMNVFCQCFLGFADVCVFSWREKPWRHVPGSDGSLLGSFAFRRIWTAGRLARGQSAAPSDVPSPAEESGASGDGSDKGEQQGIQAGLLGNVKRWSLDQQSRGNGSPSSKRLSQGSDSLAGRQRPPSHRRTHSGGSDRKRRETQMAHDRLALERADWQANRQNLEKRKRVAADAGEGHTRERQWWDRELEGPSGDESETARRGTI